ncbi:MAG TPA: UbiA family prenyltransferase [Chthoniobacteraceae bacterium]
MSVWSELRLLLKVARPGFWSTAIWFYLLPLGGSTAWQQPEFWLGLVYVTLPLGLVIYGWNDLADRETDQLNPRKDTYLFGARATTAELRRLPMWIAGVQVPFVWAFLLIIGPKVIGWCALLATATAIYNLPRVGFKNWPGVDMLNQVGYLLVFVLSSWLNHVPQLPLATFAFGALFAMHSHLFGQIMDHAPDLASGRRTTAGVLGLQRAKWFMVALLTAEALLVWKGAGDLWIAAFLTGGALFFVADVMLLWKNRVYSPGEMRFFFLAWNAVALLSIPWVWSTARLAGKGI